MENTANIINNFSGGDFPIETIIQSHGKKSPDGIMQSDT